MLRAILWCQSLIYPTAKTSKQILKESAGKKGAPVELEKDDTAFLQYTGGTTGVSKGAELTHGNICANVCQVEDGLETVLMKEMKPS